MNIADLINTPKPDERAIMTYVSCYYHAFQGAQQVSKQDSREATAGWHPNLTPGLCVPLIAWIWASLAGYVPVTLIKFFPDAILASECARTINATYFSALLFDNDYSVYLKVFLWSLEKYFFKILKQAYPAKTKIPRDLCNIFLSFWMKYENVWKNCINRLRKQSLWKSNIMNVIINQCYF